MKTCGAWKTACALFCALCNALDEQLRQIITVSKAAYVYNFIDMTEETWQNGQ